MNRAEHINPKIIIILVEIAKVQSTEASNAIEGIVTTNTRIKQLIEEKAKVLICCKNSSKQIFDERNDIFGAFMPAGLCLPNPSTP